MSGLGTSDNPNERAAILQNQRDTVGDQGLVFGGRGSSFIRKQRSRRLAEAPVAKKQAPDVLQEKPSQGRATDSTESGRDGRAPRSATRPVHAKRTTRTPGSNKSGLSDSSGMGRSNKGPQGGRDHSGRDGNDGGGGGGGGGGTCFIAGTMVLLEGGESVAIEDVKIGDRLLGQAGEINTVEEFDHPLLGDRLLYSINGGKYFVTSEHPFSTLDGWKSISPEALAEEGSKLSVTRLGIGDWIDALPSEFVIVDTITSQPAPESTQLYNFKLSGNKSYFADGYLVHNK